ncbi:MAG TPA: DUF1800 family protein, partial [Actinobacteria bacterium]|nr:DUF1800 family protein [Actinomycetota bacterium]
EAIALALDRSTPAPPPEPIPPTDPDDARSPEQREAPYRYWFTQLVDGPSRIDERLVWFWHDHFATGIQKVKVPYLMFVQHATIRTHAAGSFAELLHAIAVDPAMLIYLDGVENAKGRINENFGREVMELFTLGRGHYTEADVVAASRAFSGWVVPRPGRRAARRGATPWVATFVPERHDDGVKTLLGVTGELDTAGAIDVLLSQPQTAVFVAAKLYRELVGLDPDEQTAEHLGAVFRRDWSILRLVEEIAADPRFAADEAIRAKVRTPLERAVGLVQAFGGETDRRLFRLLRDVRYVPFAPPNVAGFPAGERLLGPYRLVHGFDLTALLPRDLPDLATEELANRLGVFDLTDETRRVLESAPEPWTRAALTINAPEYLLT